MGGFESWLSVNMTGMNVSYYSLNLTGVTQSRFIIDTTYVAVSPPTNLILTRISDNEVHITWTKGFNACYSMVRGAVGRIPEERDDGYLVYYGAGTEATDWVDIGPNKVYYRVWSQSCALVWEDEGISGSIGGAIVLMILFGILGLGLTFGFFWKRSPFFAYGAAGAWVLLGFTSFVESASNSPAEITDVYMGLFWLCVAFTIACALLPTIMREKPSKEDIYVDDIDGSDLTDVLPEKKEKVKQPERQSKFAETGKM